MIVVLLVLAVPALSLLFLQNRQVQTMVSKFLAEQLSEELRAKISLSSVNYSFFKRIQIRDLYLEDMEGDTLIYAELAKIRIKQIKPDQGILEIRRISLENYWLNLVIEEDGEVNLEFLIDRLSKPHVPPERKSRLSVQEISLINGRFSLSQRDPPPLRAEIDFNDFDLHSLDISLTDLLSVQDTVAMNINALSGIEKSGFEFRHLSTRMSLGKTHLLFNDLEVGTRDSELHIPVLGFQFEKWQDFQHFSYDVELTFQSVHSLMNMGDLAAFVPEVDGILDQVTVDGRVHGKLSDLKGDSMQIAFDQQSTLAFDFLLIGLPDFRNTFIDLNFKELNSSARALHDLFSSERAAAKQSLYPWINMGDLDFMGKFSGYPDNFVASGYLRTDMGKMLMDLSFRPDSSLGIDFHGHLTTGDFKLGEFLGQEELFSQLDMDVMVDGNLNNGAIRANLKGTVDTLYFSEYAYSNITLDGALTNKTFNGGFGISDPNIRMDFLGKMDFSGDVPSYNFTADVARSRPYFLHLGVDDPNTFASFLIKTDLTGSSLDELNGEIRLINSLFERDDDQVQLYDMQLSAINTPDTTSIEISSGLFDASMNGRFKLSSLPGALQDLADQYINLTPNRDPVTDTINRFSYRVDMKHVNPILDFFYPEIQIGENSSISGEYNPAKDIYNARGSFPVLEIGPNSWYKAEFSSRSLNNEFRFDFRSDSIVYGRNYALENQQFHISTSNDTASLQVTWNNTAESRYSGSIDMTGAFQPDSLDNRGFMVEVEPSVLYINNEQWNIDPSSFLIRKKYLKVDSLSIRSDEKYLAANGTISSEGERDFNMGFRNLNISELVNLIGLNAELEGSISGNLSYLETEGNPYIISDIDVDTLRFNDQIIGPTTMRAAWNDSRRTIRMILESNLEGVRTVEVDGEYTPSGKSLDFQMHLKDFQLSTLDRYTQDVASDLSGTGDVTLTLDGTLEQPKLNGTIEFRDGAATISYLNTRYTFNDPVRIYNNNFYLEDFNFVDEYGNLGIINGSISDSYLHDFYLNIPIEARNLNCMHTGAADNEDFYGTVFATGNAIISGRINSLSLTVDATTERNTALYLPLYNASEVQSTDFIRFINKTDKEEMEEPAEKAMGGMNLELDVDITEDAVVQLIFDPKVGDIIETSGKGNIRIIMDQNQDFTMYGDVELLKGNYLFTLQNVINKRFEIEPGGRINFNGSPTNATIDLAAIYGTRVAPYNLYPGDPSDDPDLKKRLEKRIPIECRINLQGELGSPVITSGIEMPTADPDFRDLLQNATSTDEELMKQFLSLLVINNFYSTTGYGIQDMGTMNSNIAGVTASELFSNQLSNWLSQISDDFDIGFNYRPGDQVSTQEVEVALSTQLLDDRVIISGNIDVGGQETNPSSGSSSNPYIMGDFEVEYKVTDNVSVLAFNRSRDDLQYLTAPYKQGVGVSFREEFNNFGNLMGHYKDAITNRKKRKKKSDQSDSEE